MERDQSQLVADVHGLIWEDPSQDQNDDGDGDDDYYSVQPPAAADLEAQKKSIMQIIAHQKYMLRLSSSPPTNSVLSSSSSTFDSSSSGYNGGTSSRSLSSQRSCLLELMKTGGVSLRRLFDMEHMPLPMRGLEDQYNSSSSTILHARPLMLSGAQPSSSSSSSSDDHHRHDDHASSWSPVKPLRMSALDQGSCGSCTRPVEFPVLEYRLTDGLSSPPRLLLKSCGAPARPDKALARKRSFKTLPAATSGFGLTTWRLRLRFRLRIRLGRSTCRRRILIYGKMMKSSSYVHNRSIDKTIDDDPIPTDVLVTS